MSLTLTKSRDLMNLLEQPVGYVGSAACHVSVTCALSSKERERGDWQRRERRRGRSRESCGLSRRIMAVGASATPDPGNSHLPTSNFLLALNLPLCSVKERSWPGMRAGTTKTRFHNRDVSLNFRTRPVTFDVILSFRFFFLLLLSLPLLSMQRCYGI